MNVSLGLGTLYATTEDGETVELGKTIPDFPATEIIPREHEHPMMSKVFNIRGVEEMKACVVQCTKALKWFAREMTVAGCGNPRAVHLMYNGKTARVREKNRKRVNRLLKKARR